MCQPLLWRSYKCIDWSRRFRQRRFANQTKNLKHKAPIVNELDDAEGDDGGGDDGADDELEDELIEMEIAMENL